MSLFYFILFGLSQIQQFEKQKKGKKDKKYIQRDRNMVTGHSPN